MSVFRILHHFVQTVIGIEKLIAKLIEKLFIRHNKTRMHVTSRTDIALDCPIVCDLFSPGCVKICIENEYVFCV